uniref:Translocon-associated protein subunit beta n=1 Tax=Kalanchoe fedtschenkoi TaxID=63787 RepID=A0A7N1A4A4_KALFE
MANQATASLLLVFLVVGSAFASSDVPFIVVQKKATLTRIKPDVERVSVSIDIYNQGTTTVYDVSLNDDSWPQDSFSVVSGNLSVSWEKLDAGSVLSHAYELEAKEKGVFLGTPALITYRIPTQAAPLEAYSTPLLPLEILADKPAESKLTVAKRLWGAYGSQVAVVSLVALFIVLMNSPSTTKGNKKRR